ncbi:MAG: hypothetical protein SFV17_03265 [Candidatus Obscuribacter sp.]|nr:hypothetical protein [Candidatus Obscuribacter sp.]
MLRVLLKTATWLKLKLLPGSLNCALTMVVARSAVANQAKFGLFDQSFNPGNFSPRMPLWRLGQEVLRRELVTDQDLLNLFFEKEAVCLLEKCPNHFWFWQIMLTALLRHKSSKLTGRQVGEAIANHREQMPRMLLHLKMQAPQSWAEEERALALACGLLLVKQTITRGAVTKETAWQKSPPQIKCEYVVNPLFLN